jgi:CRP-like cAMP-binding protein
MNLAYRVAPIHSEFAEPLRTSGDGGRIANRILTMLPPAEFSMLKPLLSRVRFMPGGQLDDAGGTSPFLYFPNTGLVSLLVVMKDGKKVEVGLTGNEGLVGIEGIYGLDRVRRSAVLFDGGEGLLVPLAEVKHLLPSMPFFQFTIGRQTAKMALQAEQLAACNRLHSVEHRLARWLLMLHNRTGNEVLRVTHDFLAAMLGTDRPSVSIAAALLQKSGCMTYSRGIVRVADPKRLEDCSCECYGVLQGLMAAPD